MFPSILAAMPLKAQAASGANATLKADAVATGVVGVEARIHAKGAMTTPAVRNRRRLPPLPTSRQIIRVSRAHIVGAVGVDVAMAALKRISRLTPSDAFR